MSRNKLFVLFVIVCIGLAACAPSSGSTPSSESQPAVDLYQSAVVTEDHSHEDGSDHTHTSDVDLTHLELGDGKVTSAGPQVGYVYSCMDEFNGNGARGDAWWLNGDGTWDATQKAVVDGSVTWPASFKISVDGNQRVFTGNNLPDHTTGNFPIDSSDDAYKADTNPNAISAQEMQIRVSLNPQVAAIPTCVGGRVGIALSGVVIFSAFDALGRDAAAHETQDACDGHPERNGAYHYHSLSDCFTDTASGHSALMGYALDGFGIYGYYGQDGSEMTNEDLDQCHGHTHVVEWDGQMVEMYHYHATHEFPYFVGCFVGTPSYTEGNGGGQQGQGQPNGQNQATGQAGSGQGRVPPQEAITACSSASTGSSCSFNTPNGTITGTCGTPPNATQLACMPAGGPPAGP